MSKAADAFRTISEVADDLEVPKHVLRFWENRFPQVKPMKRGGGRRYYRPADLELLRGIRHLLHNEGFTIKGVQKILREQGVETVKACWQPGKRIEGAAPRGATTSRVAQMRDKRRGKATRGGAAPADPRELLASIIAELTACRALLTAPQTARGESRGAEKRARARK